MHKTMFYSLLLNSLEACDQVPLLREREAGDWRQGAGHALRDLPPRRSGELSYSTQCCGSIPNTLNLEPDPEFWSNLDPDLGPYPDTGLSILLENLKIILETTITTV